MAILHPSLEVIQRQKVKLTDGENTLLTFLLKILDNSYEIFCQPYVNGDNPDFAIMRKGSGTLIIEVKDWNLKHYDINSETNWILTKDNTRIKSPFNQVENYKNNLFNIHSEELFKKNTLNKNNWATVNCAVYFHNATEQEIKTFVLSNFQDKKYQRYTKFISYFGILGNDSLNTDTIDKLLSKFWLNKHSYYFDNELYNSFLRYLKPPMHQLEDGIKINYTKEQQELIRSEVRPRRKIKGVAGCGKTLVLAKRAVNAHLRTGGQVLILTYNLSLKNYIHDRINDVREEFAWSNFYITNYHQFFKTQANNYNLELGSHEDWQDISFFESVEANIQRFNIVLIDEIQDYQQEWIDIIVKYFTYSDTELVVFGDEKQNIYDRQLDENNEPIVRRIPAQWNRSLNTSHRFSSNIGNIAKKFQKLIFKQKYTTDDVNVMSSLDFEKRIVEYHYFNSHDPSKIVQSIYSVLKTNEIHSSDVGILYSKVSLLRSIDLIIRTVKHEKTAITFERQEEFDRIRSDETKKLLADGIAASDIKLFIDKAMREHLEAIRKIRKNHFWMKTGTVKLSTVHSFKGWEIDTLFLLIEPSESANAEVIYTGLTRAKRNLIVFNLGNLQYDEFFRNEIDTVYSID